MDKQLPVLIAGVVVTGCLWLAGAAGTVYVAYLIVMALKKYIGS